MSKLIKEIKNKRDKLRKKMVELRKESRVAFSECVKGLFEENPNLVSFSWTQYTPYFNDGDECVFQASSGYPEYTYIDSEGKETSYDENYGEGGEPNRNLSKSITEVSSLFEDDELKEFFGDHCRVVVTKTGIETEAYDHD